MIHEIVSQGPAAPGSRHAGHTLATVQHGERFIRHLASTTNLLISGATILLRGNGPLAHYLLPTLRAMGAHVYSNSSLARERVPQGALRYLIDTGESSSLTGPENLPDIAPNTLIVDAGALHPGIDLEGFDTASVNSGLVPDSPRSGITRYRLGQKDVFVVPRHGSQSELLNTSAMLLSDFHGVHSSPVSAAAGKSRIEWAARFMPLTRLFCEKLAAGGKISGLRVAIRRVLDPKIAVLALNLARSGAHVTVLCTAPETDDDLAAALTDAGVTVYAHSGNTPEQDREASLTLLEQRPQLIIDSDSHLIRLAHSELPHVLDTVLGATDDAADGLQSLRFPVITTEGSGYKKLFDKGYGRGQSTVFTVLNLLSGLHSTPLTATRVVVIGYGAVGRGIARQVSALGGKVTVCETNPVRAAEATFDGYPVAPLTQTVAQAAIIISATGMAHSVTLDALSAALDGAVLAVAGGAPQEIAIDAALQAGATLSSVSKDISALNLRNGPTLALLAQGHAISDTAGEGDPIEIADLSCGFQLSALNQLLSDPSPEPGLQSLTEEEDSAVVGAYLSSRGLSIDS
ncbi:adenosylhomocysteinase [Lysinibacter sp. HNR]|uniref:adenosylhomocysteinase n=1 Tax=Lysinibacter sp. HNR TaxID=3031408 RepID=UPI002434EDCE|nr:adenosylhomocysteinase [Lysinibacter sp. HNR]WGD37833.1 adenosylhomocysteinase [Lysinibacter sp. HNR]